jgi:hypothetical protein
MQAFAAPLVASQEKVEAAEKGGKDNLSFHIMPEGKYTHLVHRYLCHLTGRSVRLFVLPLTTTICAALT